jgi:DNA-binding GntR family transcriptional regulator
MAMKKMQTKIRKPELTASQQSVFDELVKDERASNRELMERTGLSTNTVSAAVQVLAAYGLITREPRKLRAIRVVTEARA